MQKILIHSVLRDFKKNCFRYATLFLLIMLGMYLVVSLMGAADNVIEGVLEGAEKNRVEDGEFTVLAPLSNEAVNALEKEGIMIEEEFYLDYAAGGKTVVRILKTRKKMNLIDLKEGSLADGSDEIVLEKRFASENNYLVGGKMKIAGAAAGIIIMILFTYVISIFVIHRIEQESPVIGTLYALGVRKKELMIHYLTLPVIITLLAGTAGMALGFSPLGMNILLKTTTGYYSLPEWKMIYPLYLILYGIVMPPFSAAVTNYLVIYKKLSQPALKMIRREQKQSKISNVNLKNMPFMQRFQIRQFLREIRCGFTIAFGT